MEFTTDISSQYQNIIKILIFNQKILFGWPLLVLLIFLFTGILSWEKESQTINLLMTQPKSKSEIISAKFLAILIFVIIYLLVTIIITSIIFLLNGIGFENGLIDLYRVFDGNHLSSLKGYELLGRFFLAYLSYFSLIISFIIFISSKTRDTNFTIAIVLGFIIVLYHLFRDFNLFNHAYNPFNLIDFRYSLIGGIRTIFNGKTFEHEDIIFQANGLKPYAFCLILALIFLGLSFLNFNFNLSFASKKPKKHYSFTSFRFEVYKIIKGHDFKIYTGLLIIILSLIFVNFYKSDKDSIGYFLSDTKHTIDLESMSKQEESIKDLVENKDMYIEGYKKEYSLDDDNAKYIYEGTLKLERDILEEQKFIMNSNKNQLGAYKEKNGSLFYQEVLDAYNRFFESFGGSNFKDERHSYSRASFYEGRGIIEYMIESDIDPIIKNWPIYPSELEEYSDELHEFANTFIYMPSSHSSFLSVYRIFNIYRLDLILLFFIIILAMGGYTYDKENGNQLNLLYSQPISRKRIYQNKLKASIGISLLILASIFLYYFILGLLTEGLGDPNYPVVYYEAIPENYLNIDINTKDYFSIIPIYQYILRMLVSLAFQIIFVGYLAIFISIFFRRKIEVFAITGLSLIGGKLITNILPQGLNYISPFNHLNALDIANGSIIFKSNMPNSTIALSIGVLAFWAVIIYLIGVIICNRRELD